MNELYRILDWNIIFVRCLKVSLKTILKSVCQICESYGLCSHCTGSIFSPVRKSIPLQCEQCSGNSNRTSKLFTLYRIDMLCFCFCLGFHSKNGANLLNSPFTLGAERSRKLSDTERITFGVGVFQVIMVTKLVPD